MGDQSCWWYGSGVQIQGPTESSPPWATVSVSADNFCVCVSKYVSSGFCPDLSASWAPDHCVLRLPACPGLDLMLPPQRALFVHLMKLSSCPARTTQFSSQLVHDVHHCLGLRSYSQWTIPTRLGAHCPLEALVSTYGTKHSVWVNKAWGWPGGWMGPLWVSCSGATWDGWRLSVDGAGVMPLCRDRSTSSHGLERVKPSEHLLPSWAADRHTDTAPAPRL